jgi:hypothetical protein
MTIWWIAIGTPRWLMPRKGSNDIILQPPLFGSQRGVFSDNLKTNLPRIVSGANGILIRSAANEETTTC